jgi:hypothetical protein
MSTRHDDYISLLSEANDTVIVQVLDCDTDLVFCTVNSVEFPTFKTEFDLLLDSFDSELIGLTTGFLEVEICVGHLRFFVRVLNLLLMN